jgi:hypothetical protein
MTGSAASAVSLYFAVAESAARRGISSANVISDAAPGHPCARTRAGTDDLPSSGLRDAAFLDSANIDRFLQESL